MKNLFFLLLVIPLNFLSNAQIPVFWDALCDQNLHNPLYFTDNLGCNNDSYILAFEDEFSDLTLDQIMWRTKYDWANFLIGNKEAAVYRPDRHFIEDDKVKLFAKQETYFGRAVEFMPDTAMLGDGIQNYRQFDYTSGMIFSSKQFGYGKYEVMVKLPKGKGFWPAFWTYGGSEGPIGNDYNEIDVFEFWNEIDIFNNYDPTKLSKIVNTNTHHNFFQVSDPNTDYSCGVKIDPSIDFSTGFHKFTMIYDQFKIEWYIDDILMRSMSLLYTGGLIVDPVECYEYDVYNQGLGYRMNRAYPKFPNAHIILNLAIQDNSDGNAPDGSNDLLSKYEVEYVRFYKQVPCVEDVTILSNIDLNLDYDNYNFLTGNTVTIGDNVSIDGSWLNGSFYEGQLNISAKTQVILSSGFSVSPNSSFLASIDNNLWCCPKSLNSDVGDTLSNVKPHTDDTVFKWKIFPNPTSDILQIEANMDLAPNTHRVTLSDALGRICLESLISSTRNTLNVAKLESGMYLVVIWDQYENIQSNEIIWIE